MNKPCHYVYDSICKECANPRLLLVSTRWSALRQVRIGTPQPSDHVEWRQGRPFCQTCGGAIETGTAFYDVIMETEVVRDTDTGVRA